MSIKTFFIVHYDNEKCPSHTFLVFKKGIKYYWFEHSWEKFRGIYKYDTLTELLRDIKNKFIKYELGNVYNKENLVIHEYNKPKYNISVKEFYRHCDSGEYIDLDIKYNEKNPQDYYKEGSILNKSELFGI